MKTDVMSSLRGAAAAVMSSTRPPSQRDIIDSDLSSPSFPPLGLQQHLQTHTHLSSSSSTATHTKLFISPCVCVCVSHLVHRVRRQGNLCLSPTVSTCPAPEGGAVPATANQDKACVSKSSRHQNFTTGRLVLAAQLTGS